MRHFTVGNWCGRIIDGGDRGNCNGFLWHCQCGQGGVRCDPLYFLELTHALMMIVCSVRVMGQYYMSVLSWLHHQRWHN